MLFSLMLNKNKLKSKVYNALQVTVICKNGKVLALIKSQEDERTTIIVLMHFSEVVQYK